MDGAHTLYYVNEDGEVSTLNMNDQEIDQDLLGKLGVGDQAVHFLSDANINWLMEDAGVSKLFGLPMGAAGDLILALGSYGSDFDFSAFHLWGNVEEGVEIATSEEADMTPVFFVMGNNGETAYNTNDAGNWLWGQAARKLGVPRSNMLIGSQAFAVFSTGAFDTKADQRAIFNGRSYKSKSRNTSKPSFYKNPQNGMRKWRH